MPAAGGATDNRYAQHRTGRPASAAYRSSGADHQAWVAQGTARSGGTDHRLRRDRNRSLPPGRDPRASTSATSIRRVAPPYSRRSIPSPSFRTGSQLVLHSKTPNLVRQEFYGLMMAHFAIRSLIHEAALKADEDPDRLSFLHAIRVVRRKLPAAGAISPSQEDPIP